MLDGRLMSEKKTFQRWRLDYLIVFSIAFLLFGFWQWSYSFGDPDAFYHAKIGEFLLHGTILRQLPWMHFSTLAQSFADHHFLYHLLLVPFLALGNPLYGLKLATITFSALSVVTFYWYLRRERNYWAAFGLLILLTSSAWAFRFSLVKVNALSLTTLLILLVCLRQRWRWRLFVTQAIYVLLYGGWILGWGVAGVYWLVHLFWPGVSWKNWGTRINRQQSGTMLLLVVLGSLAGMILHPNWPANFWLYWQQIVQIGLFNQADSLNAGAEWFPLNPMQLLTFHLYVLPLLLGILGITIFSWRRWKEDQWLHLALAVIFIFFTYRSRRYIELSIPFGIIAALDLLSHSFPKLRFKNLIKSIASFPGFAGGFVRIYAASFAIIFLPLFLILSARDLAVTRHLVSRSAFPLEGLRPEAEWLAQNAPAGATVFHTNWDWWPMLFYFNDKSYYIIGLDPTFMYNYDPELYRLYQKITNGEVIDNLHGIIRDKFGARYVIISWANKGFEQLVQTDPYFQLAYQGYSARIYVIRDELPATTQK